MADNNVQDLSGSMPVIGANNIAQAYSEAWTGPVFAPGAPVAPRMPDDEKPRVFDYASGINLTMTPRSGYGQLTFAALKNFADLCDVVRIVIEAIKREIRSFEWEIGPIESADKSDYSAEIKRLATFWRKPDGVTEFDAWCNAILEDMLVYDAVTLWLDVDNSGAVSSVEQIDGTTIRPLLDLRGRTPRPPVPGYMQFVKGQNWQWFTADRMLYRPYNTSASSPYGKSPIEFLVIRINEMLRRQYSNTSYWDQTNTPEAIIGLPEEWNTEQIKTFQEYWDALLVGDINMLRRIKFMPFKGTPPVYEFRRPDATAAQVFDEWMLKMTCWAYGFLPSELGLVPGSGLGGKGFADGQENSLYRFGLGPIIQYLQNLFSGIVAMQTDQPLCWRFKNKGPADDALQQDQRMQIQLQNGAIDVNVWRNKLGQDPIPNAKPFMIIAGQPVLLEDIFNPKPEPVAPAAVTVTQAAPFGEPSATPPPPPVEAASTAQTDESAPAPSEAAVKLAMDQWLEKCKRRLADGKSPDCEPPAVAAVILSKATQQAVRVGLSSMAMPVAAASVTAYFRGAAIPKAVGMLSRS